MGRPLRRPRRRRPLTPDDLTTLAAALHARRFERGAAVFTGGKPADGVWFVRQGRLELSVGSARRRAVIHLLRPGDVDGDIQPLLNMPMPYTAHTLDEATCLFLSREDYECMLATNAAIARRWLSSVAQRLTADQARFLALLGRSLVQQLAALLLDEAEDDGVVPLPQRTIAAMLGVRRPSPTKSSRNWNAGAIEIRYAAVAITDRKDLTRHAS